MTKTRFIKNFLAERLANSLVNADLNGLKPQELETIQNALIDAEAAWTEHSRVSIASGTLSQIYVALAQAEDQKVAKKAKKDTEAAWNGKIEAPKAPW